MDQINPDVLAWLAHLETSDLDIASLVSDGCSGLDWEDMLPWMHRPAARYRITQLPWFRTVADADGGLALMTRDRKGLDALLDWMLADCGECPRVYAPQPPIEVPAMVPLLRPIATNLPEGFSGVEAIDVHVMDCIDQMFADIKKSYGNQAHLISFDYGTFMKQLDEKGALLLNGEFVDLNSGEQFTFCMDEIGQRMTYQSLPSSSSAKKTRSRSIR